MVRITPYQSAVTPVIGGAPRVDPSEGSIIGRGVQGIGQSLYSLASEIDARDTELLRKQKAADDAMWVSNTVATTYQDWQQRFMDDANAAPLGADKFTENTMKGFTEYQQKLVELAPSPEAGQMLQERLNNYGIQLQGRSLEFEAESRLTKRGLDLQENLDKWGNVLLSDPSQYDAVRMEQLQSIEAMAGSIPADKLAKFTSLVENTLAEAALRGSISANPYATLKSLNEGDWDDRLGVDQKMALTKSAEVEINQREAQAKAARIAKLVELKASYDGAMDLLKMGLVPKDAPQLLAAAKGTPYEAPLAAALQLAPALSQFNLSAAGRPAGQQVVNDLAAQLRADPTPANLEVYNLFSKAHKDAEQELAKDPLSYAIATGGVNPPEPIAWTDVASLEASLEARVDTSNHLRAFTGQTAVPFTDEEISGLTMLLKNMDSDAKTATLATMQKTLGPEIMRATADAIAPKDPMLGFVAGVASQENGLMVARDILAGQRITEASPDIYPDTVEIRDSVSKVLGTTLAQFPEMQQRMIDAAVNLAAKKANDAGSLTKATVEKNFEDALQIVAGGVQGKTGTQGGPITWQNGSRVLPPIRGMQTNEFDQRFSQIRNTDLLAFGNGQPMYGESGEKFDAQQMEDVRLMQAGDGAYMFFIPGQGYIFNDKAEPYIFNGADYVKSPPHQPVIENKFKPIKQTRYNMITGTYSEYYVDPNTGEEMQVEDDLMEQ